MATSFDEVIDHALLVVDDYKLAKLWENNATGFKTYCDGFLISAIPNFIRCGASLEYDEANREFASTLTNLEISILADYWAIAWFSRETQNSAQIANKLQTSGSFKSHSASQNLKEKSAYLDKLREKVSQKVTEYQLLNIDNIAL